MASHSEYKPGPAESLYTAAADDQPALILAENERQPPSDRHIVHTPPKTSPASSSLGGGERECGAASGSAGSSGSLSNQQSTQQQLSMAQQAWRRHRLNTSVLVNLSAIMERTDEQLLPAVYAFVGLSFGASPRQLGFLTQSRALVQALASPFGGLAGYYFNRIWVITLGCSIWGCMTALFSGCDSIVQGYLLWAVNGVGLSLVIPTGQSLTADYYSEESRGRAFGALYLTGAFGAMLGAIYATNLGHLTVFGVEGWRFAFFSVAIVSFLIGALNFCFGRDPRCSKQWVLRQEMGEQLETKTLIRELKAMCLMPTFLIIILQGIVGSTPWNALVFLTLYMQTFGMSDGAASLLVSVFLGGSAIGGFLGGWLGDLAAMRYPAAGRIAVCQFSVFVGVPLSVLLFKGLPLNGDAGTVVVYGLVLSSMGTLISWAAPACNNPIFAEIVPPHLRTIIYAFDRSFESAIAASAAPLVGLLAEKVFGWQGTATPKAGSAETNLQNARALGNAMLVCTIVPWALCGVFYSGLYWTYTKDREKAFQAARELHDVLPRDAAAAVGELDMLEARDTDASKTDGPIAEETISDDERQRLLLSGSAGVSDSSLELTIVADEQHGSLLDGGEGVEGHAQEPNIERSRLLKGRTRSHQTDDSSNLDAG